MGRQRSDGSIQSANTPVRGNLAAEAIEVDNGMYRCMVVEVYYTDDQGNLTFDNKQVTYDCIILGGRQEGQIIPNCKLSNMFAGQYNYSERILRKAESAFAGTTGKRLAEQKGDIVYVQFVQKTSNPVITGLGVHPLDKTTTGATKADGPIYKEEYNGIQRSINKNGEFCITRKGGTLSDKGYFVPADRATEEEGGKAAELEYLSRIKMAGDTLVIEDPKSSLTLDLVNESFTAKIGKDKSTTFKIDGKNDKTSLTLASGTLIDVDGAGGVITIDADGGTNQIVISKSGEITIKASSKVSVEAPLVDVGEGAAFSSTLFENLLSEFAKHTHMSTSILAPSPSSPPLAPLISLVGSQSVKVKD